MCVACSTFSYLLPKYVAVLQCTGHRLIPHLSSHMLIRDTLEKTRRKYPVHYGKVTHCGWVIHSVKLAGITYIDKHEDSDAPKSCTKLLQVHSKYILCAATQNMTQYTGKSHISYSTHLDAQSRVLRYPQIRLRSFLLLVKQGSWSIPRRIVCPSKYSLEVLWQEITWHVLVISVAM
jgi:hypothetical protein